MKTHTIPQPAPLASASLNSKERKAQRLLAHYAKCAWLAAYLGKLPEQAIDGKKISVALFKIERLASQVSEAACNGQPMPYSIAGASGGYRPNDENCSWEKFVQVVEFAISRTLGTLPPGFFVNSDPRGYALKIDNETPEGQLLIATVGLHKDMGGYGILSPEINGDR